MTIVVLVQSIVLALLVFLVAGLLRSHAEVLRRLHELGAGIDPDERAPAPITLRPRGDVPSTTTLGAEHDLNGTGLHDDAMHLPVTGVGHRTLLAFVGHYRNTAGFQKAWEEVTHVEPELAEVRRELVRTFTAGVEAALRRGQEDGTIRRDLDPAHAAIALTSMSDRTCYVRFVLDGGSGHRVREVAESLTDMWWNAVKA